MPMRKGTLKRVKQDILNGVSLIEMHLKVEQVAHGLRVTIPAQTTKCGTKLPEIIVRHKDPIRLVQDTHRSLKDALQGQPIAG